MTFFNKHNYSKVKKVPDTLWVSGTFFTLLTAFVSKGFLSLAWLVCAMAVVMTLTWIIRSMTMMVTVTWIIASMAMMISMTRIITAVAMMISMTWIHYR